MHQSPQLNVATKAVRDWVDSIPIEGLSDLPKHLAAIDAQRDSGLNQKLSQALRNGDIAKELGRAVNREAIESVLAADATGQHNVDGQWNAPLERPRLSSDQLEGIRRHGKFEVPSRAFPGKMHLWCVSRVLQTGTDVRNERMRQVKAQALEQGWVEPARRLGLRRRAPRPGETGFSRSHRPFHPFSVPACLGNIQSACSNAFNSLVGLRARTVNRERLREDLRKLRREAVLGSNVPDYKSMLVGSLREAPNAGQDVRLLDERLREAAYGAWSRTWEASWKAVSDNDDFAKSVFDSIPAQDPDSASASALQGSSSASSSKPMERNARLLEVKLACVREALRHSYASVENDPSLETLSPGLGKLLADHARVTFALLDKEGILTEEGNRRAIVAGDEYERRHSILSKVKGCTAEAMDNARDAWRKRTDWSTLSEVVERLRGEGVADGVIQMLEHDLDWHRDRESKLISEGLRKQTYQNAMFEAHVFERIWRPSKWTVERDTIIKYKEHTVDSNMPGWRLKLMVLRTLAMWKEGLYWLYYAVVKSGVGIRALVSPWKFYPHKRAAGGQIVVDRERPVESLMARLAGLWKSAVESRERFEAEPETGIIGKAWARPFSWLWEWGVKWALGSALVVTVQPLVTVLNLVATISLAAVSFAWAPSGAILAYLFDAFLYDTVTNQVLPLPFAAFLGMCGFLGVPSALACAVVMQPAAGASWLMLMGLLKAVGSAWDFMIFHGIIKHQARIPAVDSTFLVRRVAGPGLGITSGLLVQLPTEAALIGILLELEKELLAAHKKALLAAANSPVKELKKLSEALSPLGFEATVRPWSKEVPAQADDTRTAQIMDTQQRLTKQIEKAMRQRMEKLNCSLHGKMLNSLPDNRLRLTAADLARVLEEGQEVVERFVKTRILAVLPEVDAEPDNEETEKPEKDYSDDDDEWEHAVPPGVETIPPAQDPSSNRRKEKQFWRKHRLAYDNWKGLTEKYMRAAFHPGIMVPMEEAEVKFLYRVNHVLFANYANMLIRNQPRNDLDDVSQQQAIISQAEAQAGVGAEERPFSFWRDVSIMSESHRMMRSGTMRLGTQTADEYKTGVWPSHSTSRAVDGLIKWVPGHPPQVLVDHEVSVYGNLYD